MLQAVERPDRLSELGEYWDSMAKKKIDPQKFRISDNWQKKRQIAGFLLEYPIGKGEKILEIGAGIGTIISMLGELYGAIPINYTSTETSPVFQKAMVELRNRPCHIATIDNLPFEDKEFNKVWLFDVLEHVDTETREKAGQEVGRVLAPHGLVFINNPLGPPGHDDAFDFGFSQADIGNFCEQTKTILRSVDIHSTFETLYYQFIVLEKVYNA